MHVLVEVGARVRDNSSGNSAITAEGLCASVEIEFGVAKM